VKNGNLFELNGAPTSPAPIYSLADLPYFSFSTPLLPDPRQDWCTPPQDFMVLGPTDFSAFVTTKSEPPYTGLTSYDWQPSFPTEQIYSGENVPVNNIVELFKRTGIKICSLRSFTSSFSPKNYLVSNGPVLPPASYGIG